MSEELAWMDATAQSELVRTGQIKPVELVEAAIRRVERLNPRINAVITQRYERALEEARSRDLPGGPFRGVPFLMKDLGCHSAGDPYYEGSRFVRDAGWIARDDTYLAQKFRQAGFVLIGKTNTPEFGSLPTTEPVAFGPTRNPWDLGRSSGGSSGGSGAAVACGLVPVAHGNDGGGSIRIPASECGIVGLKPTRGRVSWGPEFGELWQGLAVEFVLTRTVRDTAAVLDAVSGPMPGDPYFAPPPTRPFASELGVPPGKLRVGFMSRAPAGMVDVHPDCVAAVRQAARLLEGLGHHVEESYPSALDQAADWLDPVWVVVAGSLAGLFGLWEKRIGKTIGPEDVEPHNWMIAEMGRALTALQYLQAVVALQVAMRRIAAWWSDEGFDLLLTPTIAEPPPPLGEFVSTAAEPMAAARRVEKILPFTPAFNVTGQPALSLPLYWNSQNLPIGVQLVAAYGREDLLIRVASQIEQAAPWADRRPPAAL